jgi:hypothetical protein
VPVELPETHLLAGASPDGLRLQVEPRSFRTGVGVPVEVEVTLVSSRKSPLANAEIAIVPPPEWKNEDSAGAHRVEAIAAGDSATARFHISPTVRAALNRNQRLVATYRATLDPAGERPVSGENFAWIQTAAPVEARFRPLYDIADYRSFARSTRTEWVIETLPARIPVLIGRTNAVEVEASNRSRSRAELEIELDLPAGVALEEPIRLDLPAGTERAASLRLRVDETVLPPLRHSAKLPLTLRTRSAGLESADVAELYALPALDIPSASTPPRIDGDLSDLARFARGEISHEDLWWRKKPDGPSDLSATFFLAYDRLYLYAGMEVRDDVVVCNIAPDDVKAQLRSDAIGITIDPSGKSRDTSTVLQAAAFPCTTEGFAARGFRDADANQGLMEETAKGMEVASRRLEQGYAIEARIPWSAMPATPRPGDEIGLNLVVYDGDARDARVGANVSESGIAWASFEWGGKQALPYLWPRVRLKQE